jgi:phosphoribosylformylglycinamidine synthase
LELGSLRRDALLFGESPSRVILSIRPDHADLLLSRAVDAGIPAGRIGTVGGDRFVIDVPKGQLSEGCRIDLPIQHVGDRWANALEEQVSHE